MATTWVCVSSGARCNCIGGRSLGLRTGREKGLQNPARSRGLASLTEGHLRLLSTLFGHVFAVQLGYSLNNSKVSGAGLVTVATAEEGRSMGVSRLVLSPQQAHAKHDMQGVECC